MNPIINALATLSNTINTIATRHIAVFIININISTETVIIAIIDIVNITIFVIIATLAIDIAIYIDMQSSPTDNHRLRHHRCSRNCRCNRIIIATVVMIANTIAIVIMDIVAIMTNIPASTPYSSGIIQMYLFMSPCPPVYLSFSIMVVILANHPTSPSNMWPPS